MAVVAGLAVLIAPLCADGMAMAMTADSHTGSIRAVADVGPMPAAGGSACETMTVVLPGGVRCGTGTVGLSASPVGPLVPAGALLACIGFVIAILAVVLALRPPWPGRAHVIRTAAQAQRLPVRPARPPSPAELCVLRT